MMLNGPWSGSRSAQLPCFDRLSRYKALLLAPVTGQILFALDALDRRKPRGSEDSRFRLIASTLRRNPAQPGRIRIPHRPARYLSWPTCPSTRSTQSSAGTVELFALDRWIVANHKMGRRFRIGTDKTRRPIDATIIEPPDPPIFDAEPGRDGRAALSRKISEPLVARINLGFESPSKPLDLMPAGLSLQYFWLPSEIAVTRSDCCSTFRSPGAAPVGLECSRCAVLRA